MANQIEFVLAEILIIGVLLRKNKIKINNSNNLNKERMQCLKGIASIMIVSAHGVSGNGVTALVNRMGFLAVAFFFFCSAYGLLYCSTNINKYLDGFIIKKLKKIYIPFVVFNIIYLVYYCIENNNTPDITSILRCVVGIELKCGAFWYIQILLLFYFSFYICCTVFFNVNKSAIVVILGVGYTIYLMIRGPLYAEMFQGLVIIMAPLLLKDEILLWIRKNIKLVAFTTVLLFFTSYSYIAVLRWHMHFIGMQVVDCFFGIVAVFSFVTVCIIVIITIDINNKICCLLGNISFEIYLVHLLVINVLKNIVEVKNDTIMLIASIAISILLALVVHYLKEFLDKKRVNNL